MGRLSPKLAKLRSTSIGTHLVHVARGRLQWQRCEHSCDVRVKRDLEVCQTFWKIKRERKPITISMSYIMFLSVVCTFILPYGHRHKEMKSTYSLVCTFSIWHMNCCCFLYLYVPRLLHVLDKWIYLDNRISVYQPFLNVFLKLYCTIFSLNSIYNQSRGKPSRSRHSTYV